jgi:MATE family multidrug resistance protein
MMKKTLWASYLEGLGKSTPGESYAGILHYFWPECVTALVTYCLVSLVDAQFIACMASTMAYATVSLTNTVLHCVVKIGEGLSVGTMVLCGIAHGRDHPDEVGKAAGAAILVTSIIGALIASFLFFKAGFIYRLLGAPEELVTLGIPFLRLRAVSIFLMFLFVALTGFLRGIKQNDIAMRCYVLGTFVFIICDYVLIFGKCGFPQLCLQGSAWASIIQYTVMITSAFYYIWCHPKMALYATAWSARSLTSMVRVCALSLPVMCDKAVFAIAKLVLVRAIAPMGAIALSSFGVIRDIEMFVFVPAIAYAQVVTFLVSNEMGAGDIEGVKYTIKKVLLLALSSVIFLLLICVWNAEYIISCFDVRHTFSVLAVPAFRILSILVICDVAQVILSGALRGVAQMGIVLRVRAGTLLLFCIPVAYILSRIVFQSDLIKFITIYSSFYIGNGFMVLCYVYWLRTERWRRICW